MINIDPTTRLKYFKCLVIFLIIPTACEKNAPVIRKGIPKPSEYAKSRLYAVPGFVAANVKVLPRIGPTQGVHPAANAIPNTNDVI